MRIILYVRVLYWYLSSWSRFTVNIRMEMRYCSHVRGDDMVCSCCVVCYLVAAEPKWRSLSNGYGTAWCSRFSRAAAAHSSTRSRGRSTAWTNSRNSRRSCAPIETSRRYRSYIRLQYKLTYNTFRIVLQFQFSCYLNENIVQVVIEDAIRSIIVGTFSQIRV